MEKRSKLYQTLDIFFTGLLAILVASGMIWVIVKIWGGM